MPDNLKNNSRRDLILQAGMELIPYVGGSMATLYFGSKHEKRFARLESFYKELSEDIKRMGDAVKTLNNQNPIALEALLESLHEKVEVEPTQEKREFFKNYFKNTLKNPVSSNYDERKYYLESLAEMSLLECELLAFLRHEARQIEVGTIQKPGVDQYAIVGAIGRLKSRGFLIATQGSFAVTGLASPENQGNMIDNSLREIVKVSSYGESFCNFCLSA